MALCDWCLIVMPHPTLYLATAFVTVNRFLRGCFLFDFESNDFYARPLCNVSHCMILVRDFCPLNFFAVLKRCCLNNKIILI